MKRNRCKKIREWIEPYFDDELSLSKHAKVEAHLKECPDCRKVFNRLKETQKLIRHGFSESMAGGHPDLKDLHSVVRDRIGFSASPAKERSVMRRPLWSGSWGARILAPSALAVVLIAVFVFTIYKPPAPVIRMDGKNECIVETLEGGSRTVMLFKTHGSNMTVIWLSGGDESNREAVKLWRKYSV